MHFVEAPLSKGSWIAEGKPEGIDRERDSFHFESLRSTSSTTSWSPFPFQGKAFSTANVIRRTQLFLWFFQLRQKCRPSKKIGACGLTFSGLTYSPSRGRLAKRIAVLKIIVQNFLSGKKNLCVPDNPFHRKRSPSPC